MAEKFQFHFTNPLLIPGLIESFGSRIFGYTPGETAQNVGKMYAFSALLGSATGMSRSLAARPSRYIPLGDVKFQDVTPGPAAPSPRSTDFYGTSRGVLVPVRTPAGVRIQPHTAERMGNPPQGRREVSAAEVDALLQRGALKKAEYDIYGTNAPPGLVKPNDPATWRLSVTLQVSDLPGEPQVVINPDTNALVSVIVPTQTPKIKP